MKKSILLVDDAETVLLFEKTMLRGLDADLRVAHNGAQAVADAKRAPPDLVLLDIMMPELNGIEACRQLKQDASTRAIPVIMVTTKGEPEMVEKAFEAGCDDYVTKPLNKMELLSKVTTYLG